MKSKLSSRLLLATSATLVLATPTAAFGFAADCANEGQGSAVAAPCDDIEVLPESFEREDEPAPAPAPAPDPEAAPDVAPETLTATGVDSGVLAIVALGAVAAGGTALLVSRKRGSQDV